MQIPLLREKIPSISSSVSSWAASLAETSASTTKEPPTTMGALARLTALVAALSPTLVLSATPAVIPEIKTITFSGSGCPSNPKWFGTFDNLVIDYGQFNTKLPGDSTLNCQVHLQGSGGSPGWQVALRETWVTGHAYLQPGTKIEYLTTSFFSQNAARTVRIQPRSHGANRFADIGTPQNTKRGEESNNSRRSIDDQLILYNDLSSGQAWSECFGSDGYTGIFNVNTRIVLSGDGRANFEAQRHQWTLDWRRC